MRKLRVCIADEALNLNQMDRMIDFPYNIEFFGQECEYNGSSLTHGTLCMLLLLKALHNQGVLNQVKVSHFSVSAKNERLSYNQLLNALDYCFQKEIDILSLSIGLTNRHELDGMVKRIRKLDHTLIIAAAANSFSLTYPAALAEVLGVRRSLRKNSPIFERRYQPPDGTEIIANYSRSILQEIAPNFGNTFENSNSVIVPQIVAVVAKKAIEYKQFPTKAFALSVLTADLVSTDTEKYELPNPDRLSENDMIPIILLPGQVDIIMVPLSRPLPEKMREPGYSNSDSVAPSAATTQQASRVPSRPAEFRAKQLL